MKKKIPTFKSDRAAAAFVDKADLSRYDVSGAQLVCFEIKRTGEKRRGLEIIRKPRAGVQPA